MAKKKKRGPGRPKTQIGICSQCRRKDRPKKAKGLCAVCHEKRRVRRLPPCTVDGCKKHQAAKGLCVAHYKAARRRAR